MTLDLSSVILHSPNSCYCYLTDTLKSCKNLIPSRVPKSSPPASPLDQVLYLKFEWLKCILGPLRKEQPGYGVSCRALVMVSNVSWNTSSASIIISQAQILVKLEENLRVPLNKNRFHHIFLEFCSISRCLQSYHMTYSLWHHIQLSYWSVKNSEDLPARQLGS